MSSVVVQMPVTTLPERDLLWCEIRPALSGFVLSTPRELQGVCNGILVSSSPFPKELHEPRTFLQLVDLTTALERLPLELLTNIYRADKILSDSCGVTVTARVAASFPSAEQDPSIPCYLRYAALVGVRSS